MNNVQPAIDHEKNERGKSEERKNEGFEGGDPFLPRVSQNLGTFKTESAFSIDAAFQMALLLAS